MKMKLIAITSIVALCLMALLDAKCQDVLYKHDGTEVFCKIIEIDLSTIKFIESIDKTNEIKSISKKQVNLIVYSDGQVERFLVATIANPMNDSTINTTYLESKMRIDHIKFHDLRINKLYIGEIMSRDILITGTTSKVKDKKGLFFDIFKKLFIERLNHYMLIIPEDFEIEIGLKELFYKQLDQFSHWKYEGICRIELKISRLNDDEVYLQSFDGKFSSKASDLRNYAKANGYKWGMEGTQFLMAIDDIVRQMKSDTKLMNEILLDHPK